MWKRGAIFIVFVLLALNGLAQTQYRAIFSGGRAYVANDNKFVQIQNGQLINAESQIELVGNALVVLMDGAGRLTTFSLSGKYTLENLSVDVASDSALFVKSVWDTYYQNFGKENVATELLRKQAEASKWTSFELLIPSSSQFYSNDLIIQWSETKEPYYTVDLINEFGEVFKSVTVDQAAVPIDLADGKLAWKDEVTVKVRQAASGKSTGLYSLDRLSPPDYEKMERVVSEHFQETGFEMLLTKAAFFENEWLFADAITLLFKLREERGELMKDYWQQYLIRNGFYYTSKL